MPQKILVVDDEPDAVELIAFNLKGAGYEVVTAADGAGALQAARKNRPDLMILDLMIPGMDGLEVCRVLRKEAATAGMPIIMLTARASEIDRVLGLELGADDYVTKPFSVRELLLRVRKRLEGPRVVGDAVLVLGPLRIDPARHSVLRNGKEIGLTATEFKLLQVLAERRGRVQSREQLLRDVWEYDAAIDTRTVDTHMRRLRNKLGSAADCLDTVRGVGYRLVDPEK